jgi:hypothetical protein
MAIASTFRALSRVRGARIFHPGGTAFAARWVVDDRAELPAIPLFERGADLDAIVRLSRGAGLPHALPDVLGLAVRVVPLSQDVLLVTTPGGAPVLRRLLLPAWRYGGKWLSSLVSFDAAGRRLVVGAHADAHDPTRFRVAVAAPLGAWQPVATLLLGDELPDDVQHGLRFDPWHDGGGLRPVGLLNRLRARAYPASQEGRPDT